MSNPTADNEREQVLQDYRRKCRQHREVEETLKRLRLDTQVCDICIRLWLNLN